MYKALKNLSIEWNWTPSKRGVMDQIQEISREIWCLKKHFDESLPDE